jgi:hypothetical protein
MNWGFPCHVMVVLSLIQVKDYHERQFANTQTTGEIDGKLSSTTAASDGQLSTTAASAMLPQNGDQLSEKGTQLESCQLSTAVDRHEDDRLEIAKDGLGLILRR